MLASRGVLRALLALDVFLLLCCVSLAGVTASGPSQRALGRSAGILTEVDTYLDQRFAAIHEQAGQTQDQQITLPDFPMPVSFAPQEIDQADRETFRALLLERSGALLHDNGAGAFRQDAGPATDAGSASGLIRLAIDFLRPLPHNVLVGLSVALGVLAAWFSVSLARTGRGLRQISLTIAAGGGAFLALSALIWLGLRLAASASDDYLAHEFLTLARQLTWAPVREGLIVMVGAAAVAAAGAVLPSGDRRSA